MQGGEGARLSLLATLYPELLLNQLRLRIRLRLRLWLRPRLRLRPRLQLRLRFAKAQFMGVGGMTSLPQQQQHAAMAAKTGNVVAIAETPKASEARGALGAGRD